MFIDTRVLLLSLLVLLTVASQVRSEGQLAVTIYNDDFAMVKDVRYIQFDAGQSVLYFTDVSSNIQTQTVTFKALYDPAGIRVYEQNFESNLVSEEGILQRYIGQEIDIVADFGEQARRIRGTLLSQGSSFIIKTQNNRVIIAQKVSAIELPALPEGFFTKPTLNWKVWSERNRNASCQVAYRTTGFSWKSDYTLVLNQNNTQADIGGWVTIDNQSGKKYVNAKLKLIAGNVNTVQNQQPQEEKYLEEEQEKEESAEAAPSFSQKSFADYHLYTLSQLVTLNESSQKQVEFIPRVYGVPIRKFNEISIDSGGQSEEDVTAESKCQFVNSAQNGLGIPFPQGTVRVFQQDPEDRSLQFIGEDSIDHTPKDQNITLLLGNSFDLKANLVAKNKRSFQEGGYSANMNLIITNHKDSQIQVIVLYDNYYGDNLKIDWDPQNKAKLQKISADKYQLITKMHPNQQITFKWEETQEP